MEERRLGQYYHAQTQTTLEVEEWGKSGKIKHIEENRLTRNNLQQSQLTTFKITYPNGEVVHRTFSGYLPTDLDSLVDYWTEHESL